MFLYFFIFLYLYYNIWLFIKFIFYKKNTIEGKNILLLTAHPDDEIMFFFPTIKNLKHNNLYLLCLSNGNYENLGKIREKEIQKICQLLNFRGLFIEDFEDDINNFWDTEKIQIKVNKYIQKHNIDILITFDNKGISYHPNHISCNIGTNNTEGVEIFNLETVYFYRKYIGYFDIFNIQNNETVFFNLNILQVIYYMVIHWSQMKWYRLLFLIFSRYSYVNNLKKIK